MLLGCNTKNHADGSFPATPGKGNSRPDGALVTIFFKWLTLG